MNESFMAAVQNFETYLSHLSSGQDAFLETKARTADPPLPKSHQVNPGSSTSDH